MTRMPAVTLAALPGRRAQALEAAREIERRGFSGAYCTTAGGVDNVALSQAIAQATTTLHTGPMIAPIYFRIPAELARGAALAHELSGGRIRLGIGVSHAPSHARNGVVAGKPLADVRAYVAAMRAAEPETGPLPPIVLACLRTRMLELAVEIADGAVWANPARSHLPNQLARVPAQKRAAGFFVGALIPTCISDDEAAAKAALRRQLTLYCHLPNYRNYWREAGWVEEMDAIEAAIAAGDADGVPARMSDRWLADVTLFGSATRVRDGIEAAFDAGITTPVVVPSSARKGGSAQALSELFAAYA